jgi:hypothetical protein
MTTRHHHQHLPGSSISREKLISATGTHVSPTPMSAVGMSSSSIRDGEGDGEDFPKARLDSALRQHVGADIVYTQPLPPVIYTSTPSGCRRWLCTSSAPNGVMMTMSPKHRCGSAGLQTSASSPRRTPMVDCFATSPNREHYDFNMLYIQTLHIAYLRAARVGP